MVRRALQRGPKTRVREGSLLINWLQLVDICVGQKIISRIVFVEDEAEGGAGAHEDGKEAEGDATGNEEGDDGDKGDGDKGADGKGEDGKGNDGDKGDDGKGDDGDGDEGDEPPAKSTSPYVAVTSLSAKNGEYIPGCSLVHQTHATHPSPSGTMLFNSIYVVWCGHQRQGKRGKAFKQRQRAILVIANSKEVALARTLISSRICIFFADRGGFFVNRTRGCTETRADR